MVETLTSEGLKNYALHAVDEMLRGKTAVNVTSVDPQALDKTRMAFTEVALGKEVIFYHVDGLPWKDRVSNLVIDTLRNRGTGILGWCFMSFDPLPLVGVLPPSSYDYFELPGIVSEPNVVVRGVMNRLDSEIDRKLLRLATQMYYFDKETLEDEGRRMGIITPDKAEMDPYFISTQDTCWEFRNEGLVRWDPVKAMYEVRPILRDLLNPEGIRV